jgi:hypothetical protein
MSTTVVIGYGNGYPLETSATVDLLVEGKIASTATPDANGAVTFDIDIGPNVDASVRLSTQQGSKPKA